MYFHVHACLYKSRHTLAAQQLNGDTDQSRKLALMSQPDYSKRVKTSGMWRNPNTANQISLFQQRIPTVQLKLKLHVKSNSDLFLLCHFIYLHAPPQIFLQSTSLNCREESKILMDGWFERKVGCWMTTKGWKWLYEPEAEMLSAVQFNKLYKGIRAQA